MRGVTDGVEFCGDKGTFQLTRLMRGVTRIHTIEYLGYLSFQLTRLMRGVTNESGLYSLVLSFQLTRLMRGVTKQCRNRNRSAAISTHTPHARRDGFTTQANMLCEDFNSHASCEA